MAVFRGRRIQSRRALAILTWIALVVVAWLLWRGQRERVIRIQAWEPAALLLSAYATFLAIFGWLLFSPGRQSAEESPGLFFGGMLTLLPPCFIAYNLMPAGSPLRPWLTIGVFLFGIIAIMSPLPAEVFAVPRDRRTYLQPLTDAYLSSLDVDAPEVQFETIVPETRYWLTQPQPEASPSRGTTRDPWTDPFYGTGRQMSRIGVSQSRRGEELQRSPERRRNPDEVEVPVLAPPPLPVTSAPRPASEFRRETGPVFEEPERTVRTASSPVSSGPDQRSSGRPDSAGGDVRIPGVPGPGPSYTGTRRPLTEPGQRPGNGIGFQASPPPVPNPPASRPPVREPQESVALNRPQPLTTAVRTPVSPPPLPASSGTVLPASPVRPSVSADLAAMPVTSIPPVVAAPIVVPPLAPPPLPPLSAALPVIGTASSSVRESRPVSEPVSSRQEPRPSGVPQTPMERAPAVATQPVLSQVPSVQTPESRLSLQEVERQIREEEARENLEDQSRSAESVAQNSPSSSVTSSVQQLSGDISLERIRDEHGGEMVEGTVKVFFEVGQKRAHLHVPFSPPLPGIPEVECEPTHDDGIRLKVAVRQPYGIRIEARRTEAAEALKSEVSFAAVYTPSGRKKGR